MRIAKQLLEKGEQELFEKQHYQPKKCEYNDTAYKPFHLHLFRNDSLACFEAYI
jgi:hypothetical protein